MVLLLAVSCFSKVPLGGTGNVKVNILHLQAEVSLEEWRWQGGV